MSANTTSSSRPRRVVKPQSDFLVVVAVALFGLVLSAVMLPLFDPQAVGAIVLTGP
jgi:hypothetical protein